VARFDGVREYGISSSGTSPTGQFNPGKRRRVAWTANPFPMRNSFDVQMCEWKDSAGGIIETDPSRKRLVFPRRPLNFFPIIRAKKPRWLGHLGHGTTAFRCKTLDSLPATDLREQFPLGYDGAAVGVVAFILSTLPVLPSAATGGASSGAGATSGVLRSQARQRAPARFNRLHCAPDC